MNKILAFIFILVSLRLAAQPAYDQFPDFETNPNGHYSTGLGIADINGDGWKDIIVSNGNDMQRQRLVVYYNNGDGTFPADPSWQSNDIDYHGHLAAGDIDNDGDVDIAVSVYLGPSGFGYPGKAKIYYNSGTELELTPSFQTQYFYTFSCALGDADADGDLDLAVACGEPYGSIYDYGRIFYNNGGGFEPIADWQSNVQIGALDVEFGDVDQNGYLDLVFICENTDNYVFLADNQGNIDEDWDWYSNHPQNFMNSLDIGKSRINGPTNMVCTGNNQLGGDGKIKQFTFTNPLPQTSPPTWESDYVGYGSGILMADINHDEYIDLLYGSWWGPLTILEGDFDVWVNTPVYQATATSVVESIQMSDLGKFNYHAESYTIKALTQRGILMLDQQIIEKVDAVYVNGVMLDRSEYCFAELKNWIAFKDDIMPGDVVKVEYDYMYDGDIVISNWDPAKGNYIYYNTVNPVGITEYVRPSEGLQITGLSPVPTDGPLTVRFISETDGNALLTIHDLSGRILHRESIICIAGKQQSITLITAGLPAGVLLLKISNGRDSALSKFYVTK